MLGAPTGHWTPLAGPSRAATRAAPSSAQAEEFARGLKSSAPDRHNDLMSNDGSSRLVLPRRSATPAADFARRIGLALGLIVLVAGVAYFDRDGYVDAKGDGVSLLDAFYYATVSITTTGYGDVRPESDSARLLTTLIVTPARILFLILLVGTTLELLTERTRETLARVRFRRRMRDHVIICGFGTKGRSAAGILMARGTRPDDIVVVDEDPNARDRALAQGFAVVVGSAADQHVLQDAGINDARVVIVAPHRDDTSVLITLTARECNPTATIVAAVREEENVHLLHQGGANSVITTSGAAGRLMGIATESPGAVEVLEDLLSVGEGLDIYEHTVTRDEAGPIESVARDGFGPVLAVLREEELLRFDDPRARVVLEGDRLVSLRSHPH